MNRYDRYPGDYLRDTIELSLAEDGAYTRLLDWYYANERPIDHERRFSVARAHTEEEQKITQWVLGRFFKFVTVGYPVGSGVWVHERADREIELAKPKIEAARNNGKKGGRPRKAGEEKPSGYPSGLSNENPVGIPVGNPLGKLPSPSPSINLPPLPSVVAPQGPTPKPQPRRRTRVPADWQPTDKHRALATEVGADLRAELETFRDHEFATPKSDFNAAFANWLRRTRTFGGRPSTPKPQRGMDSRVRCRDFEADGWDTDETPSQSREVKPQSRFSSGTTPG